MAVIHEGSVVQIGSPQQVFTHPQNEDVALSLVDPSDTAGTGVAAVRPASSVRNRWYGVIDTATPAGLLVRVAVRLDCDPAVEACFGGEGEVISLVTRTSAEELDLVPGRRVVASVKAAALHVLAG